MARNVSARPRTAPHGAWRSPVTADAIVAGVIGLSQVQLDGDDLYWVEQRPAEEGRNVIVRVQMASLSGGLASMGAAVPYAIAAKFAHPERPVIALIGDGAMQMNNMAELITVSKYWRLCAGAE